MGHLRGSGVLLHPTSLPGPYGAGDIGRELREFLAWLERAGQRYWQVLPLHPPGFGGSPYSALSAFAANPLLVDLETLADRGWLDRGVLAAAPAFPGPRAALQDGGRFRMAALAAAATGFFERAQAGDRAAFDAWCRAQASWLDDFALFMAIDARQGGVEWTRWPTELARREPAALEQARQELQQAMQQHRFAQWAFAEQWAGIRKDAASRGIRIIGDVPIFVALHSADVWANPGLFHLGPDGVPKVVAGVPPDYFSETGQRWGNPLYRWDEHERQGYSFWIERFRAVLATVDIVRIDHFRGFAAYWEIPASEPTAVNGRWVPGPGASLFSALERGLGALPIVAEDLGVITPDVADLRDRFHLPGMKVLQFAFGSGPENAFLPHNYVRNCIVYTGTHDNDTTRGWFATAGDGEKHFARQYLGTGGDHVEWDLIRAAEASIADLAVVPLQDVLSLGSEGRMNRPGLAEGNWDWRLRSGALTDDAARRLRTLVETYGRLAPPPSASAAPAGA